MKFLSNFHTHPGSDPLSTRTGLIKFSPDRQNRAALQAVSTPPADLLKNQPRNIIYAAFEALITVDEQQRIVMMNPAAERMFGCTEAEALGSELQRFIPPPYRASHTRCMHKLDASSSIERPMSLHSTIVGMRGNGQEFVAEVLISRVDMAGAPGPRRYFTALLRELNAAQGLQANLESIKHSMRALFEFTPRLISMSNEAQAVYANRVCSTLFGAIDRAMHLGKSVYALLWQTPYPSVQYLSDRVQQDEELEHSRQELRRLSIGLATVREKERRRIARELHDELGQRLTALKIELSSLAATAPDAQDERVASMLTMIDETVASVRRIATDLRPLILDDLGLNAAIEWQASDWARRTGIQVMLQLDAPAPAMSECATIALYRMVQEALTNVARHAHASAVHIELRHLGDELVLTVQDNGSGFSKSSMHRRGSRGLVGIRERVDLLGGELKIGNAPGGGGCISVRLPFERVIAPPGDIPRTALEP